MKQLNKTDLVNQVVKDSGCKKKVAEEAVDNVLVGIINLLGEHKDETPSDKGIRARLTLVGFGAFMVKDIKGRKVHNPNNGDESFKADYNRATFKPGKLLQEEIKK